MTVEERLSPECSICGKKSSLVRDHCHKTGFIRGILCTSCNTFLGKLENRSKKNKKYLAWYREYKEKINIFRRSHVSIPYESFAGKQILFMLRNLNRQQSAESFKADSMNDFLERINVI